MFVYEPGSILLSGFFFFMQNNFVFKNIFISLQSKQTTNIMLHKLIIQALTPNNFVRVPKIRGKYKKRKKQRKPKFYPTAKHMAFDHMIQHFNELKIPKKCINHDVWFVFPTRIDSKQTIKLNRELGVHKINKQYD